MNTIPSVIFLQSVEGFRRLQTATHLKKSLVSLFRTKLRQRTCGMASISLVMNGKHVAENCGDDVAKAGALEDMPFYEQKVYDLVSSLKPLSEVDVNGMILDEVYKCLKHLCDSSHEVSAHYTDDTPSSSMHSLILEAFETNDAYTGLIANFDLASVGYLPPSGIVIPGKVYGHMSPIGGYHKDTDSFLILDNEVKTKPAWIPWDILYNAMDIVDSGSPTGKKRGVIVMKHKI